MLIFLSTAKSGSPDRWDALPYISFDRAKEGKPLEVEGKKKRKIPKRKRRGIIDTSTKGAERVKSDVQDTVRFQ